MGSIFVSFLLPLLAGYIYIRGKPKERFFCQTETGYQYIIRCIAYGTFFIICSSIFLHILSFSENFSILNSLLKQLSTIIERYTSFMIAESYLLALGISFLVYIYYYKKETVEDRTEIIRDLLQEKGSEIETMLFENVISENYEPILISLKSRKVYVGYVLAFPLGGRSFPDSMSIEFLPEKSGHRNVNDLKLKIDHDYITFWKDNRTNSGPIKVSINLEDIESVSPWNEKLYMELNKKKTSRKPTKKKVKKASNS